MTENVKLSCSLRTGSAHFVKSVYGLGERSKIPNKSSNFLLGLPHTQLPWAPHRPIQIATHCVRCSVTTQRGCVARWCGHGCNSLGTWRSCYDRRQTISWKFLERAEEKCRNSKWVWNFIKRSPAGLYRALLYRIISWSKLRHSLLNITASVHQLTWTSTDKQS
jgi:hypothetical protein